MKKIESALKDLAEGHPVLVYDADGREEEVDIMMASELVRPEDVRFMRKNGGGLICTTMAHQVAEKIGLPFLVDVFKVAGSRFRILKDSLPANLPYDTKSAFSLTINHRKCYTGITDKDRAMTISEFGRLVGNLDTSLNSTLAAEAFTANFRIPGHVVLLRTSKGILKNRFGHTELATAMCIMGGLSPSATICEMIGDDGNAISKELGKEFSGSQGIQFLEGKEIVEAWREWCG